MDKYSLSIKQLMAAVEYSKGMVGQIFYQPLGIEPSAALNAFTLYFLIGALAYAVLRLILPDHTRRTNYRNNEFGLRRNIYR